MTIGPHAPAAPYADERGSVAPLVIGMVLCILLLGAGVTAGTSAFLSHQRLQSACDGAAARSADASLGDYYGEQRRVPDSATAHDRAAQYLAAHHATVSVAAASSQDAVHLTCRLTSPVAFGSLFGVPEITVSVDSVGHSSW